MAQLAHGAVQLFKFEWLLDHCDRSMGENAAEDLAVRIASDDDDGDIGMIGLERLVDFVARHIRQFQIEENQIEMLFISKLQSFLACADDNAAETSLFQELFEQLLQGGIVIDDEDGRLTGAFIAEHVAIQQAAFDAPAAADLDGGQLPALD